MKNRRYLYGAMGLLSVLGFIGILSDEKAFLAFFAFAVDFQYLFIKSDEMLEVNMNKSAAGAFCGGMIGTALISLFYFFIQNQTANEALLTGLTYGWVISVIVYALTTSFYCFRENWGLGND